MTRCHRLISISVKMAQDGMRFKGAKSPFMNGSIRECFVDERTSYMSEYEKKRMVYLIAELLCSSLENGHEIMNGNEIRVSVVDMIQKQRIKVCKLQSLQWLGTSDAFYGCLVYLTILKMFRYSKHVVWEARGDSLSDHPLKQPHWMAVVLSATLMEMSIIWVFEEGRTNSLRCALSLKC